MSLKRETPCDYGDCPYNAYSNADCEWWCGADEPEDFPVKKKKHDEKDTVWLIIEDTIEEIYKYEPNLDTINIDKIIEDLEHIQTCIDKKVYDREEN